MWCAEDDHSRSEDLIFVRSCCLNKFYAAECFFWSFEKYCLLQVGMIHKK